MKTIATFPDLAAAEMARSILRAEGIPALIPDGQMAGLDWRLGTALGGVRLQVAPEHAEVAARLLDATATAEPPLDSSESLPDERCPFCKSTLIGRDDHRTLRILSLLIFPILVITLPIILLTRGRLRCHNCRRVWGAWGESLGRQAKRRQLRAGRWGRSR